MAQLSSKIKLYLDREIDFLKDVKLQDDGDGAYIKEWNVAEAQPTEEQLNALESEATTLENDIKNKKVSDKESGKQKLKDLGLTDDEIKAVTGV